MRNAPGKRVISEQSYKNRQNHLFYNSSTKKHTLITDFMVSDKIFLFLHNILLPATQLRMNRMNLF
jgi:hypothetical protein